MTTATISQTQTPVSTLPSELEILMKLAAAGKRGVTLLTGEEVAVATRLVRAGYARIFDALGVGVPNFIITPAGTQHLATLNTSPLDVALKHWRISRMVLENLAYEGASGHLYDMWARWDDLRETVQALMDGGYIKRRGSLRRRGVDNARYTITPQGRELLSELRAHELTENRPTPQRVRVVGNCKVELYEDGRFVHITLYVRHAGMWYPLMSAREVGVRGAFRRLRRQLSFPRNTEALENLTPQSLAVLDAISRGHHSKVNIRLATSYATTPGGVYTYLDGALRNVHMVETSPGWYEKLPVAPSRALVSAPPRAIVPAIHFQPVPVSSSWTCNAPTPTAPS